jgi:outer membrane protease
LLAQPTNIGSYEDSTFAVLPEASINVGYQVTRHVRTFVGYTFLYLNNTVRAADAIDPVVNSTQIGGGTLVGDARPAFSFDDESSLWLQGVNVGVDVRF